MFSGPAGGAEGDGVGEAGREVSQGSESGVCCHTTSVRRGELEIMLEDYEKR